MWDSIWVKARSRSQPTHSAIAKREACSEELGRFANENMEAGGETISAILGGCIISCIVGCLCGKPGMNYSIGHVSRL
jgi:hypothetical protein